MAKGFFDSFYELSGEISGQDETTASWHMAKGNLPPARLLPVYDAKKFNIGLAIGGDFLLDKNRHDWLYH
jgi:hypothetical protein